MTKWQHVAWWGVIALFAAGMLLIGLKNGWS